jgi:hypothetical protein
MSTKPLFNKQIVCGVKIYFFLSEREARENANTRQKFVKRDHAVRYAPNYGFVVQDVQTGEYYDYQGRAWHANLESILEK